MSAVDPQITASELLRIFYRDEPYLFMGAAFTTVAIMAAAFSFLRRKVDSLTIYFALFAFLYGQRLWIQAGLLGILLDSESQELRYSAAGHPPMLLLRQGSVRPIEENGLMLAAFDFAKYSNAAQSLEPGDRLLLYTDGIVEAADGSGTFFGQDSLSDLLCQTSALSPSEAADRIIASVAQWAVSQDDDLTVLVCDYVGADATTR